MQWLVIGIAVMLIVIPLLQFWYVNHWVLLGSLLIAALIGASFLTSVVRRGKTSRSALAGAAVGVLTQVLWFFTGWYPLTVIAQSAAVIVAFICFAQVWSSRRRNHVTGSRRAVRWGVRGIAGTLTLVAAVLSIGVIVTAITPAPLASALQGALGYGNSYEAAGTEGKRTITDNGDLRISDIEYGTDHPNSYLDIYIADNDATTPRPTYVYVHGGGWIVGGKASGDPAAGGTEGFTIIGNPMLDAGYNVVSIDYGLAPGVSYPTPIIQLAQAVSFLQDNASEFGLDMSQVVLAGASAGGQIVGQFANIQTNLAYADAVGITPVMQDNLKAVVLDSAALDIEKTGTSQTPVASADWLYTSARRAYLGLSASRWNEADVIKHVSPNYPPAFIADGNTATFPDQAQALHNKLDEFGVRNELLLYTKNEAVLGHGFMASPTIWTDDYQSKKIAFLETVLQ